MTRRTGLQIRENIMLMISLVKLIASIRKAPPQYKLIPTRFGGSLPVILIEDLPNKGEKGEVVKVRIFISKIK